MSIEKPEIQILQPCYRLPKDQKESLAEIKLPKNLMFKSNWDFRQLANILGDTHKDKDNKNNDLRRILDPKISKGISKNLKQQLYTIYLFLTDQFQDVHVQMSADEKEAIKLKLNEGITGCATGFQIRVAEIFGGLLNPFQSIDVLLARMRNELVGQSATSAGADDIHDYNYFFKIAAAKKLKLGVVIPLKNDLYPPQQQEFQGKNGRKIIESLIEETFLNHYTPFRIIQYLQAEIIQALNMRGYRGRLPKGALSENNYTIREYEQFLTYLGNLFDIEKPGYEDGDLVFEEDYLVKDINWKKLWGTLWDTLNERGYFKVTPTSLKGKFDLLLKKQPSESAISDDKDEKEYKKSSPPKSDPKDSGYSGDIHTYSQLIAAFKLSSLEEYADFISFFDVHDRAARELLLDFIQRQNNITMNMLTPKFREFMRNRSPSLLTEDAKEVFKNKVAIDSLRNLDDRIDFISLFDVDDHEARELLLGFIQTQKNITMNMLTPKFREFMRKRSPSLFAGDDEKLDCSSSLLTADDRKLFKTKIIASLRTLDDCVDCISFFSLGDEAARKLLRDFIQKMERPGGSNYWGGSSLEKQPPHGKALSRKFLNFVFSRSTPLLTEDDVSQLLNKVAIDKKHSELMLSIKAGCVEFARQLFNKRCFRIMIGNVGYQELLMSAVSSGNAGMVDFLLKNDFGQVDFNLNQPDQQGMTLLHKAVQKRDAKTVLLLLENGADINLKNRNKQSALELISQNAELKKKVDKYYPLIGAAISGSMTKVKKALEEHKNINGKNDYGMTALHEAAQRGHFEMVIFLCENGADISLKNNKKIPLLIEPAGKTALELAQERNHQHIVKYLTWCREKRPSLLNQLIDKGDEKGVKKLLDNRAITKIQNEKSFSIQSLDLHRIIDSKLANKYELVKQLLDKKNDPSYVNQQDLLRHMTPLHYAAQIGDKQLITLLLQNGASFSLKEKEHPTVFQFSLNDDIKQFLYAHLYEHLISAVKAKNIALVESLLEQTDHVNYTDKEGMTALDHANQTNDKNLIELLLKNRAVGNLKNKSDQLHSWQLDEKGSTVQKQMAPLKNDDLFSQVDENDRTLLHLLLFERLTEQSHGYYRFIEQLLCNINSLSNCYNYCYLLFQLLSTVHVNINLKDKFGMTPLHYAAQKGDYDIFSLLLKYGADPDAKNIKGETAEDLLPHSEKTTKDYHRMILIRHQDETRLLREAIDKEDMKTIQNVELYQFAHMACQNSNGLTALHVIAKKGVFGTVERDLLVNMNKHIINLADNHGRTPLTYAVQKGRDKLVSLLIQHKADVNHQDKDGMTPLHKLGEQKCTKLSDEMFLCLSGLLEAGADVGLKNNEGETALDLLLLNREPDDKEIIKFYIYAQLTKKYHSDEILSIVLQLGNVCFVEYVLVRTNNNLDKVDKKLGMTPLHYAIEKNDAELVKLLLDKKADVNKEDNASMTPLRYATKKKDVALVKLLLDKKADPNKGDNASMTPLHHAAQKGDEKLIALLLARGARVDIVNNSGRTAMSIARANQNTAIINCMVDHIVEKINEPDEDGDKISNTLISQLEITDKDAKGLPILQVLIRGNVMYGTMDKPTLVTNNDRGCFQAINHLLNRTADDKKLMPSFLNPTPEDSTRAFYVSRSLAMKILSALELEIRGTRLSSFFRPTDQNRNCKQLKKILEDFIYNEQPGEDQALLTKVVKQATMSCRLLPASVTEKLSPFTRFARCFISETVTPQPSLKLAVTLSSV